VAEDAWQPLAKRIARGDVAGVVALLEVLDEPARKRLSTQAKRAAKEAGWGRSARDEAARAAQFGTGGAVAAVRQWWIPVDRDSSALRERLVRCRPRAWRQEWAQRTCSRADGWAWNDWKLVRAMVKEGLLDRPEADGYVTGAVTALPDWSRPEPIRRPLAKILRDDPAWLEHELWQLFAIEETGLTTVDAQGAIWQTAFVTLAADGVLPRDRLLDESLGALRRDFAPHHARWYQRLFAALQPSVDELAARVDDLLALLAAENPANLALGLKALTDLERAKRLPADAFLDAVGPALTAPAKVHATRAVKLAGRVLRRAPEHARSAAPVLLVALAHEAREVQGAVLDILERHATALGEDDRARLASVAATLDPALRPRAAELVGEREQTGGRLAAAPIEVGEAVVIPGRRVHDFGAPRLRPDDLLAPVAGIDDLLDRAATALERGDDPDEIELVLDAISRLRDVRPDPARATALTERATELHFSWLATHHLGHARDAVAMALLRWLKPRANARIESLGRSPVEAIAQRLRELLGDLGRPQPRALLAAPTHRGGWVDAAEAVRRVAALDAARPPVMDLAQLVLRIAPDGRAAALRDAAGLRGEAAAVLACALGGDARRPWLARLGPAWDAAHDARDPAGFVAPESPFNDLSGLRAQWRPPKLRASAGPQSPASLALLEESWWGWEANGLERWLTRVWPARRDGAYVVVCRRLWANTGTREHGIGDVLELLLDPAEPIAGHGALAVALGLGAADATDRTLAADIAIAALRDRRLDGASLGALLARILRDQNVEPDRRWHGSGVPPTRAVPSRWATALADIAGAGQLHAHDVQVAIEAVLAAAGEDDRRRLLVLVDLLRRLAAEAGAAIRDPGARAWLEALAPRSKAGRAAHEALAVAGDGAARSRAALRELKTAAP
jgi:hypothetical protein